VKKSDFCRELEEALNIEPGQLSQETTFMELDIFDSFFILALVSFMDKKFDIQLTASELQRIFTVKDLMAMTGHDFSD
jgi:acyl carrier protein